MNSKPGYIFHSLDLRVWEMFHLVQLLAGESVNHIIKTTCHKKIALEASWIAHSWNKVQEFSASVEEAHPWLIIGIWVLDWMAHHWSWLSSLHSWIPCLILRASSDLLDIISLYSKYFKVCSSFCFVAL